MPLYEYRCQDCRRELEALVRPQETPSCPGCGSANLERLLSLFGVSSESTRQFALRQGRKHASKTAREKAVAEREYVEKHHH